MQAIDLFLQDNLKESVWIHLLDAPDPTSHFSVELDMIELLNHNMILGHLILLYPAELLPMCDEALRRRQSEIFAPFQGNDFLKSVKPFVHARIVNLPLCPEVTKRSLPSVADFGRLISIQGLLTPRLCTALIRPLFPRHNPAYGLD